MNIRMVLPEIVEAETMSLAQIQRGKLMHRFPSDEAVENYCEENYLDDPRIEPDGSVMAWCRYTHEWVSIGWIR